MRDLAHSRVIDAAAWSAAAAVAPYGDEARVKEATEAALASGSSILQIHRLAPTEDAHMREIAGIFDPPHGARVLDVGSGVGEPARLLRAIRPDLDTVLVNISPWQLNRAGGTNRVAADAHALPIADRSMGAVMALYSMGHLVLVRAMTEFARVLRPGGVLFIWDIAAADPVNISAALGYRPHPVHRVMEEASMAGFINADVRSYTRTNVDHFVGIVGDALYNHLFDDVRPVSYRFVRR